MGWENVASPYVVISPTSGLIFVYSGTPSASTLKIVIAAVGGTVYGVTYPAGITVFGTTSTANPGLSLPINSADEALNAFINSYIQGSGNGEYFGTQYAGPQMTGYTQWVDVALFSATKDGTSDAEGDLIYFDSTGVEHIMAAWSGTGIHTIGASDAQNPAGGQYGAETWHALTGPAGWSGTLRYKLMAQSNFACLDGHLTFTAYGAKGNQAFPNALPAGYRPTGSINVPVAAINATALAAPSPSLTIQSNGILEIYHGDTGTTGFDFTAIYATN